MRKQHRLNVPAIKKRVKAEKAHQFAGRTPE
jgi:hypothetical protein